MSERCNTCGELVSSLEELDMTGAQKFTPIPPTSAPTPEPLADICPSCGSTDKTERMPCANAWHDESQPEQETLCGVCRRPLSLHVGFANRPCSEIPSQPQQVAPPPLGPLHE